MSTTNNLNLIANLLSSDGGLKFIKIKLFMQLVEEEIELGNKSAIQFDIELNNVLKVLQQAANSELVHK